MELPQTSRQLAALIELALLKADATSVDIEKLCADAKDHQFQSVIVSSSRIAEAYALLEDTDIKLACLVGFPFGAMHPDVKRYEVEVAIDEGAQAIEAVLNIAKIKERDEKFLLRELRDIVEAAEERPVTAIVEATLLSKEEKTLACNIATEAGVQFVSTSTGFNNATVEDITVLKAALGAKIGVKASGGIQSIQKTMTMLEAGAARIVTTSGSAILRQFSPRSENN